MIGFITKFCSNLKFNILKEYNFFFQVRNSILSVVLYVLLLKFSRVAFFSRDRNMFLVK